MILPSETPLAGAGQMLLGLTLVMGLMALAAWALKRFQSLKMREGGIIKTLGSVSAGTHGSIMVVEVGDQWLVVGVTPSRMDILATLQKKPSTLLEEGCDGRGGVPEQKIGTLVAHDED